MQIIEKIPESLRELFTRLGGITSFTVEFLRNFYKPPYEFREIINQSYQLGYRSLFLVSITGFIIGVVMTLQLRPTMVNFGAESWLPSMISISIIREIGPVLTALICAGKIASGIGVQLGSMRVTEQINQGDGLVTKLLYDSTWAVNASPIMDTVSLISRNLGTASREIRTFTEDLNNRKGSIHKLLTDTAVARDVEASISNIRAASDDLEGAVQTVEESWILNLFNK